MKIGAGWLKKKDDKTWYSCRLQLPFLGELNITIYKVKDKQNERAPDIEIFWNPRRVGNINTEQAENEHFDLPEDIPF